MKLAFLHQSKINRSEMRLFITTEYSKTSSLIYAVVFWSDDRDSRDSALTKIRQYCKYNGYELNNGE